MSAGDVEGTVHNVSADSARLSLIETTDLDSGVSIPGILHFYSNDIASCVVLDNTSRKKHDLVKDEEGPRLLRVRPMPAHLERLNASVNSCEFICHRSEGDDSEELKKGIIELMGPPDMLPKLQRPLPAEFEVIDQVNDRFQKAMAAIKAARSISVGFEGTKISRHGSISVLAVATLMKVFIFDVFNLKEALFDRGLREILESNDTEKVIHGCRHLSDCLYHRYKVTLNNVFDTMVADVVIYYGRKLDAGQQQLPRFVRGLQNCLRGFLNLTQEQLKYTRSRQGHQEELLSSWEQRPLTLGQIDALVKDTVYLAELSHACLKQLLLRFQLGVQFFLGLERNCSAQELDCLPPDHILPAGFKDALRGLPGPHRHYDNYDQDCNREYGRYGRNNENNRYQHRGQQQWRDNRYWRDQGRGRSAEPRGARSQGDAVRGGQRNGLGSDLLGEACQADDSLVLVAMRHQGGNCDDDKPGDTTAQVPVMANGHAGLGPHGAMNGHGYTNALSGANNLIDSESESSDESEHEVPLCSGRRTEEMHDVGTHGNGKAEPIDLRKFVGMSSAVPGAGVKETSMAVVGSSTLLSANADRGEEIVCTALREQLPTSPDACTDANQGSPGLSPSGWGARPMENKYKEMSFRPADMQVLKYSG